MSQICSVLAACLLWMTATPEMLLADCPGSPPSSRVLRQDVLKVVTLNIAHGRGDSVNQMLVGAETIRENLLVIAELMKRSGADVVALQEMDAESRWSGNFNHLSLLANRSGMTCAIHGIHASGFFYRFGTALLSKHPFTAAYPHHFKPNWPTTRKGFVVATLPWNPGGRRERPLHLKLVSVHLDFSRRSVRHSQISEMVAALSPLSRPMVIMGDFNADWSREDASVRRLASELDLHPYEPQAKDISTYGDGEARLDWILLSRELQFRTHDVYPDVISDHLAVAAEIAMVNE